MLGKHKQKNKLSYLVGIIFVVMIFSMIITKVTALIDKNGDRHYISTSLQDLYKGQKDIKDDAKIKENMIEFYEENKEKYVRWKMKVNDISNIFDVAKCNASTGENINKKFFIKCKFKDKIDGKFKVGEIITVSGKVSGYSEFFKSLELKNCRIEK